MDMGPYMYLKVGISWDVLGQHQGLWDPTDMGPYCARVFERGDILGQYRDPTDIGLHHVLVHVLYSSTRRDILGLLGDYWAVQVPSHCTVYVHIMGDYHSTHDPLYPRNSQSLLVSLEQLRHLMAILDNTR